MSDERAALRDLLGAIQRRSAIRPGSSELARIEPLIGELAVAFQIASEDFFGDRFYASRESLSMVQERQGLFLRSPQRERGVLPVMMVDATVSKQSARVKVQVAMFNKTGELSALGYRFEYGTGTHSMLHCQHVVEFTGLEGGAVALPGVPAFVPTNQPSFPLDGRSKGVHCVLAAYVSIYGLADLPSLVKDECPSVQCYLKNLHYTPKELRAGS